MLGNMSIPVLASTNQKGGVGKTTSVMIFGEFQALERNRKVLLVDLDMQCNTSDLWVGMEPSKNAVGGQLPPKLEGWSPDWGVEERSSIADIFWGHQVCPHSTWLPENEDKPSKGYVDCMVGHPHKLETVSIEFASPNGHLNPKVLNRLREFLSDPGIQDTYDLIILDTGPTRTPLFHAALRAATHALVPFKPEEMDFQGMNAMRQVILQENLNRPNEYGQLKIAGLLPNQVRSNTHLHQHFLSELRKKHSEFMFPEDIFIPQAIAIPERNVKGIKPKSIFHLKPSEAAYKQAWNVCIHLDNVIFAEDQDNG